MSNPLLFKKVTSITSSRLLHSITENVQKFAQRIFGNISTRNSKPGNIQHSTVIL